VTGWGTLVQKSHLEVKLASNPKTKKAKNSDQEEEKPISGAQGGGIQKKKEGEYLFKQIGSL
jgi:hypothetical protein